MDQNSADYVHALRYPGLTRFYDSLVRTTLPERALKTRLCAEALEGLEPGGRVLDLGCGTGTLTLMLKRRGSTTHVVGLDGDPQILQIAREKATRADLEIEWRRGDAMAPPFAENSFDRVVSSLVFHHLNTEGKRAALRGVHSLLKPGGRLHLLDWGRPHGVGMRLAFLPVQLLDGFETTADNVAGRIPALLEEAGFASVEEATRRRTVFGTLSIYRGTRA